MAEDVFDRVENAVATIRPLLERGELISVAYSGGKDSTATLICAVEAMKRVVRDGYEPLPLVVQHNNTRIENPEVEKHAARQLHDLEEYAADHELPLMVRQSEPSLADAFTVKVIGGLQLPNYANSRARACSVDWKVRPGTRQANALLPELRRRADMTLQDDTVDPDQKAYARRIRSMADAIETPVMLVGTRSGESAQRARRTAARGEMADNVREVTDNQGRVVGRTLSPILDWDEEDVWELLGVAGNRPGAPVSAWRDGFDDTVRMYRDSGGECVITQIGKEEQNSAGCGARHGCAICLVTGAQDKSLGEMLRNPAYSHLHPIMRLRSWLIGIRGDYGRRSYLPRKTDGEQLHLAPGGFDADTCAFLLKAFAQLDIQERDRAEGYDRALREGRMPVDPELQRKMLDGEGFDWERALTMREPQFQFLGVRDLITIDYQWSLYGLSTKPFHALKLYSDIVDHGERVTIPEGPEPLMTTRPPEATVHLPGLHEQPSLGLGLDETNQKPVREARYLDVDTDRARRVIGDISDPHGQLRRVHEQNAGDPTLAARFYLTNGIVMPPKGHARWIDRRLRLTERLMNAGVHKGMSLEELFSLSDRPDGPVWDAPRPRETAYAASEPVPAEQIGLPTL